MISIVNGLKKMLKKFKSHSKKDLNLALMQHMFNKDHLKYKIHPNNKH